MRIFILLLLAITISGCGGGSGSVTPPTPTPDEPEEVVEQPNTVQQILDDMRLPHAAAPHGVPSSFDWANGPRLGFGNDPGEFTAFITWGQLYEAAEGNPATNSRVHLRHLQAWLLDSERGEWRQLQYSLAVDGAAYREDFAGDISRPADIRFEDDGAISVTAGDGYNFHFWPAGGQRVSIEPHRIGAIWVTMQARLVVDDRFAADDRAQARYLLGVGADYWLNETATWDQWRTNGDVGIGRFRWVTRDWQWFNMTTADAATLERYPPPLDAALPATD